jgi:hypothetical protein
LRCRAQASFHAQSLSPCGKAFDFITSIAYK